MKSVEDINRVIALAKAEVPKIVASTICMAVTAIATAAYAYLVGPVLKSLFTDDSSDVLSSTIARTRLEELSKFLGQVDTWVICALIVAAALIKGISFFIGRSLLISAGQRVLLSLRSKMYWGLLSLNPISKMAKSKGELVTRFTIDAETVEQAVTGGLLSFIRDGLQIVALCALALLLDPFLGLIGLIAFGPIAALILKIGSELRKRKKEVYRAFGIVGESVNEAASGLGVIRSFDAASFISKRFSKRSESLRKKVVRALVLKAVSSPLNEVIGAVALAATLIWAGHRIEAGLLSAEAFISFFTALVLLYQPVKGLGEGYHLIQSGVAALDRLGFLIGENSETTIKSASSISFDKVPSLSLQNVQAEYEEGKPILKGIDLNVAAGDKVAIVGPSGSGKSTIVNLLCGYLIPSEGEIFADKIKLNLKEGPLHRLFAPVMQEPFLFDDTIEMNIRLSRPGASQSELQNACEACGISDIIAQLPEKLQTVVGPCGTNLSLGQRQRVCLARALLSDAPILVLDEVTAALDGETERSLVEGIDESLNGRSVIVVTHRLSTAKWANRLALIEDGTIREEGFSRNLLEENVRIKRLFGQKSERASSL